jgi:formylglycine-generating enzyme required for sulfatase activity
VVKWPQGVDCRGYRLPTEAEWEYAARADEGTVYAGSNKAEDVAWFSKNSEGETHEVKSKEKLPNQWGLYDLSGNVMEWVWDEYGPYKAESSKNPVGPLLDGSRRVYRGGSWDDVAGRVRVAYRSRLAPGYGGWYLGFRLVRSYP